MTSARPRPSPRRRGVTARLRPPRRNWLATKAEATAMVPPSIPESRPRWALSSVTRARISRRAQPLARMTPNSRNRSDVLISIVLMIPTHPTATARLTIRKRKTSSSSMIRPKFMLNSEVLRVGGLDQEARDRRLLDAEQVSGRGDIRDDGHVQDDRAGFIQAHDGERPVANPESVSHLPLPAIGSGVFLGDLGANDDVPLAPVGGRQEAPAAAIPGQQVILEDPVLQLRVLDEVLALDDGRVKKPLDSLLVRPGEQVRGRPGEQTTALNRRGDLPDLRGDHAYVGDLPDRVDQFGR